MSISAPDPDKFNRAPDTDTSSSDDLSRQIREWHKQSGQKKVEQKSPTPRPVAPAPTKTQTQKMLEAKAHQTQIEGAETVVKSLCCGILTVAAACPELFHDTAQILSLLWRIVAAAFVFAVVDVGVHGLYHRYCMEHQYYDTPAPKLKVILYGLGVVAFVFLISGLWLT